MDYFIILVHKAVSRLFSDLVSVLKEYNMERSQMWKVGLNQLQKRFKTEYIESLSFLSDLIRK